MSPARTVLIVTSSYAPAMIADMHRARLLAWELPAFGWNVEVLAPDSSYQFAQCLDGDSAEFFCPGTPVHYTRPYRGLLPRFLRSSSIGWKALLPLLTAESDLLKQGRIDLVYLSTTQFNLFLLGRLWRARYGVPYVLDIQDPVFKDPGGYDGGMPAGMKRTVNKWLQRKIEETTVPSASALVSVSDKYTEMLKQRYRRDRLNWMRPLGHAAIPFGASELDLALAGARMPEPERAAGEPKRVIYVGAGGVVMARAFRTFCHSLAELIRKRTDLATGVLFELYGTDFGWHPGKRKELSEIAAQCGVAELVVEEPARVTYRKSLEILLGADGAMVFGVDDEGYMPSKLYSYALSGKPLLGVMRAPSSGHAAFVRHPGIGHLLSFGDAAAAARSSGGVLENFVDEVVGGRRFSRTAEIAGHLAPAMARRHAEIFDSCVGRACLAAKAVGP